MFFFALVFARTSSVEYLPSLSYTRYKTCIPVLYGDTGIVGFIVNGMYLCCPIGGFRSAFFRTASAHFLGTLTVFSNSRRNSLTTFSVAWESATSTKYLPVLLQNDQGFPQLYVSHEPAPDLVGDSARLGPDTLAAHTSFPRALRLAFLCSSSNGAGQLRPRYLL